MMIIQRRRRKRCKRQLSAHPQPDDDVDDASFPNALWMPITIGSILLLVLSLVLGLINASLGDPLRIIYAVVCAILFALTTSYVVQTFGQGIRDGKLNTHLYRNQTLKDILHGVGSAAAFIWMLYVPSLIIPAIIFRKGWLAYGILLLAVVTLGFSVHSIFQWWRYHTDGEA